MTPDDPNDFDLRARTLHRQALAGVSPPVLARLREARRTATTSPSTPHPLRWVLAGGTLAAALAMVLVLQFEPVSRQPAATPALASAGPPSARAVRAGEQAQIDAEIEGMLAALDENPDLYLWLAANDDALPPPSEP